jgi:hemolysin activation/secretion protein
VRGYDEREIFGDAGYVVAAELYAPPISIGAAGLRGLVFFDYGLAFDEVDGRSEELASYGAGLRFQISDSTAIRFDYGWQVDAGESRGHAGVIMEF